MHFPRTGWGPRLSGGAAEPPRPKAEAREWFKCLIPTGRPMSSWDSVAGLPSPLPATSTHGPLIAVSPRARDGTPGLALGVPQAAHPRGGALGRRPASSPVPYTWTSPCLRPRGHPLHFHVRRGEVQQPPGRRAGWAEGRAAALDPGLRALGGRAGRPPQPRGLPSAARFR